VRDQVQKLLAEAVERAVAELEPGRAEALPDVQVGPTKTREHGDFACNAALMLAKSLGRKPREIAERIVAAIEDAEAILSRVEIAGPGFINCYLAEGRFHEVLARILEAGAAWGHSEQGAGERVLIEFVSANPTGPLHIGHGRNAAVGDAIARLLEATGSRVTREYYFNDAGRQMRVLAESLRARYEQALGREAELPEEGYQGEYLVDVARSLAEQEGDTLLGAEIGRFQKVAEEAIFADIRGTLERLGIRFDVYYNENSLYTEGRVEQVLEDLRGEDLVYEQDGASWFRAMRLGHDRDRVLIRSSGEPTYLLPDIAYHREKFRRGFERLIDVWGPDHIEQFPYLREATARLGFDGEKMEVVHYQWVNLRRGGELVSMSTRAASFVSVEDLLDEVGPDVFRYFMLERRTDTHFDFDVDLAKDRSERNPVYKIQYAHARMCSIERKAEERGTGIERAPLERLDLPAEIELAKRVARFPEIVLRAAGEREPQEVARYLLDLATSFHTYVSDGVHHRVLSDDADLSRARLALVRAIRTTLGNGLALLGIGAPERM
jgi:arginyl-tRNA synthetase